MITTDTVTDTSNSEFNNIHVEQISTDNIETKYITMRFSDSDTINLEYDENTNILSLISKAIIYKHNELSDININFLPEKYLNLFKVVYRGKIIKISKNLKVIDIIDIKNSTILHCVFPQLQKSDIIEIKENMHVPLETINKLLISPKLIELLKIPTNFNFLKSYIENNGKIHIDIQSNKKNFDNLSDKNDVSSNDLSEETLYSLQINEIINMGFECNDNVKHLLKIYNGDVQNVLNNLLG